MTILTMINDAQPSLVPEIKPGNSENRRCTRINADKSQLCYYCSLQFAVAEHLGALLRNDPSHPLLRQECRETGACFPWRLDGHFLQLLVIGYGYAEPGSSVVQIQLFPAQPAFNNI